MPTQPDLTKLKPGGMGDASASGRPAAFAHSMASDIEDALDRLLRDEGRPRLRINDNSAETRDRRMLFVAIAEGVVAHLKQRHLAFDIVSLDTTIENATIVIR